MKEEFVYGGSSGNMGSPIKSYKYNIKLNIILKFN